jgi:hypothetical protein
LEHFSNISAIIIWTMEGRGVANTVAVALTD